MNKLVLKNIHKAFDDKQVLDGIDLTLAKGESLVVIGGSGTGKSVMLRCVLGLTQPDEGIVEIDGKNMTRVSPMERKDIGMLFQNAALFDSLSVWENVSFALLYNKKMPRAEARKIALAKLEQVGLGERTAELRPVELSGGMQKRVGLARAIATNPSFILFDEPTTGLDPITADAINDLIVATCKNLGTTILSITHDMASARKIADRMAMIYQGKIIWQGAASDIDHSGSAHVEQFINGRADGPIENG
jgi:phospholipid/cholesterol/gamma-HCH transport system ATP-binding protein